MRAVTLRRQERSLPDEACRVLAVACERGALHPHHTHDFPELFWLQEGTCRHRINGLEYRLKAGELVPLRATDEHSLVAIGRRRFVLLNVELAPRLLELFARDFPEEYRLLYDDEAPLPRRLHLPQPLEAQRMAHDLSAGPPTLFRAMAFLCDLVRHVFPADRPDMPAGLPDWLEEALLEVRDPSVFTGGARMFVERAGRSHEHVTRTCRRLLGKTPAQLVNERRMEFAERELRLTARTVLEIAMDCGFSTTAQFYKLFRTRFGLSPTHYRQRLRAKWITPQDST